MTVDTEELELRRLELDQKKAEQEYQVRLKELGLKEAEVKRSRWSSPLVLSIIAATIAAAGNGYISWLNGANQLAIESTRNASQRAIEQEKAEAARILEATKSSSPNDAAAKIKFLIEVGLISDPNRQAALEAYLESSKPRTASLRKEEPRTASSPKEKPGTATPKEEPLRPPPPEQEPIIEEYQSGWLGGGNNQADQCRIGRTVIAQKHPGKSILLKSSSEQSKKDFLGRVEYRYSCVFEVH
jgi:hypothetical protein